MKMFTQIFFIAFFALAFALSQKNGDEGLPYEFGFTIDGEQHRHEKKDVRGIIEGEFGFITADGIYHVTVYATDENGKFKILSMKNLRISAPLDGSPLRGELSPEAEKYRKKAGLSPLPQAAAPAQLKPNPLAVPQSVPAQQIVVTTPKSEGPFKFTTQPTVKPACASCGFITTPEPKPFEFQNPIFQKQDQEKQQQSGQSGALPDGPLSVPIPIAPFGSSGGVQNRFEGSRGQSQGQVQSIVGQQQGSSLPAYQPANGPQNTNYHSIGNTPTNQRPSGLSEGSQYSGGGSQGAQYSSGGTQDSQYPIGGSQVTKPSKEAQGAQYPSGDQKVQYPSIGVGGTQYPSGGQGQGAQYPEYSGAGGGQNNIDGITSNSGFGGSNPIVGSGSGSYGDDNDKGSFGSSGPVGGSGTNGFGGSIGGGRPSYQQGGALPNALQTPQRRPPTEVSNFPPTAVSDGVIHVGGKNKQDIPIKNKYPGMQDGLPAGIEEKDITDLLYKFHYTVGFHGHYEKGLKNGAKVGGYFVNGRDGISRVVTYVADENGYRPKVKFINLGLSSDETPKAETEKTFGLKSFEFVWYPVD